MGWGLEVPMYLSRVTKDGLQVAKEESEDMIKFFKNQIIAAVAYTQPTVSEGEDSWSLIEYASMKIPEILDEMIEEGVKLSMIKVAIDNIDEVKVE
jgi:enterochelin esterase-like enzyme